MYMVIQYTEENVRHLKMQTLTPSTMTIDSHFMQTCVCMIQQQNILLIIIIIIIINNNNNNKNKKAIIISTLEKMLRGSFYKLGEILPKELAAASIVYTCNFFKETIRDWSFIFKNNVSMTLFTDYCTQNSFIYLWVCVFILHRLSLQHRLVEENMFCPFVYVFFSLLNHASIFT